MTKANEQRPYRPERLPQAAEQTLSEGSLRAALTIVRNIHQTGEATALKEPETADERWEIASRLQLLEEQALRIWATESNSWLSEAAFTKHWREGGEVEGSEHQVYELNGIVYKRNNLFYHSNWLEYFHRLVLHNWLFPETAVDFLGLMLVNDDLQPVITQKALLAVRGAERKEVENEMKRRGFYRRKADDYYNPDLGVMVEDLHDENVLVSPKGSLLIFDPVLYLARPEMNLPVPVVGRHRFVAGVFLSCFSSYKAGYPKFPVSALHLVRSDYRL